MTSPTKLLLIALVLLLSVLVQAQYSYTQTPTTHPCSPSTPGEPTCEDRLRCCFQQPGEGVPSWDIESLCWQRVCSARPSCCLP